MTFVVYSALFLPAGALKCIVLNSFLKIASPRLTHTNMLTLSLSHTHTHT